MPLNRQLQSGLSKAAGILSPTVYAKQQKSQMLQEQNDLAMRQTALKSVIESIKSGQLPGEQAVPAFQQLGLSPETSTLLAQNIRPTPVDNTDLLIKRRDQIAERVSLLPDNDPRKQVGLNRLGEIDSLIQQKTGFEGSSDPALFANVPKMSDRQIRNFSDGVWLVDKEGNRIKRMGDAPEGMSTSVVTPDGTQVTIGPGSDASASVRDKVLDRKRAEKLEGTEDSVSAIQSALDDVERSPGTFGIGGAVINSKLLGLLAQIPGGREAREGASQLLTGETAEKVSAVRTRARTLVAQQLSAITGEESGRFTETERQIAEETLKSLEATSDVDQIRGAYKTMLEINLSSRDRERERLGIGPKHDVLSVKGRKALAEEMIKRGYSEDEAIDYVIRRAREKSFR